MTLLILRRGLGLAARLRVSRAGAATVVAIGGALASATAASRASPASPAPRPAAIRRTSLAAILLGAPTFPAIAATPIAGSASTLAPVALVASLSATAVLAAISLASIAGAATIFLGA
ncbi:MAG TPA: hypothetical protein VHH73_01185 [Verrucomicrobiae bacterium]|nr:hypothetical protein [Verrucomicrobiae bacterium]